MIYIAHYGVGHLNGGHSGRYKWGTGERPKQSEEGTRKGIEKIKDIKDKISKSIGNKISERREAKELKKQRENEIKQVEEASKHQQRLINAVDKGRSDANKEYQVQKEKSSEYKKEKANESNDNNSEYEKEKARVLRDGTAAELIEWAPRLSNQELQSAYSRLQTKQNLERLLPKEPTTFERVNKAFQTLSTVNSWATTSINTYRNVATIAEMFDIKMPGSKNNSGDNEGSKKNKKKNDGTDNSSTNDKKENRINPYVPPKKRNKHEKLVQETYEKNSKEAYESIKNRVAKMDERNKEHQQKINNMIKENERKIKAKQNEYDNWRKEFTKKYDKTLNKQLKKQWEFDNLIRTINRNNSKYKK